MQEETIEKLIANVHEFEKSKKSEASNVKLGRRIAIYPNGEFAIISNLSKILRTGVVYILIQYETFYSTRPSHYNYYLFNLESSDGLFSKNGWSIKKEACIVSSPGRKISGSQIVEFESPVGELIEVNLSRTSDLKIKSKGDINYHVTKKLQMIQKLEEVSNYQTSREYSLYNRINDLEKRMDRLEIRLKKSETG